MHYLKTKRAVALIALLIIVGLTVPGHASNNSPSNESPSSESVAFAQRTSDLMLNELLAALFQEFNETTVDNVEEGKRAISLIFNDANRDMRLIGVFGPLQGGSNDLPADSFEQTALVRALQGQTHTSVERIGNQWFYRRSIALSNTFHQACVLCHSNFSEKFFKQTHNSGQWVGALTLRTPIRADEDEE